MAPTPKEKTLPAKKAPRKRIPKAAASETAPLSKAVSVASPVLTPVQAPAPAYSLPDDSNMEKKKKWRFEQFIANESILDALQKAGCREPHEKVTAALPSLLQGKDILIGAPEQRDVFLLPIIGVAHKILSQSLAKGTKHKPVALFLCENQKFCENMFSIAQKIFRGLEISLLELKESAQQEEIERVFETVTDVLITTPKALLALKESPLQYNNLGFFFVSGLQSLSRIERFNEIFSQLPADRVQKIFVTNENTPFAREMSFKFLDEPESFSFLPSQIKDRYPRQIAHALPATQKFQILLGHLKTHKPACAIVFANTKLVAEWLYFKLHGNDIKTILITSSLNAQKRSELIKSIHSGETNIIVTTDLSGKNIGLEKVTSVYNFDLSDSPSDFLVRLNKIQGSRNPIAVSFICEDYGFNMGAIEEALGFKIHIVSPDKNYFNIKDTSEYPLEITGKVKKTGVVPFVSEKPVVVSAEKPVVVSAEKPAVVSAETPQPLKEVEEKPQKHIVPSVVPSVVLTEHKPHQRPAHKPQSQSYPQAHAANSYSANDKFVRRDERAKELVESAKSAAKRTADKQSQQMAKTSPKRPALLKIALTLVQDAVHSATVAARDSLSTNIQQNLPMLSSLLKKFNIMKRDNQK